MRNKVETSDDKLQIYGRAILWRMMLYDEYGVDFVRVGSGLGGREWKRGLKGGWVVWDQQKYSKGMQSVKESGQFKKLKWTQRPRGTGYPSKRWGHTAVIHEGKLLVYGGNHSGVAKEGIYKIDCESLEGGQIYYQNVPQIRESHSCNIIKDSLYIFGGCINQEVSFFNSTHGLTNDLLQFKLAEPSHYWRKIEQKNPIPPRESHVSLTLSSRHILIYGGTTPEETMLDDFWLIDLQTCLWQQVTNIKGLLEPKIGCTMTLVHNNIYVFGGEYGEGEESQYSSDLYKLNFDHDNYSSSPAPGLTIAKMDIIGTRPAPRTGHCCVDYKGKMLIIIGGEGVSVKQAAVLYNDIWTFDLRTSTWTELLVENRSNFRPRSNFTANIYKSTVYIFGGFINLSNFKCTDDFVTITLHETKHHDGKNHHHHEHESKSKLPLHCALCKFEFLPQGRLPQNHKNQQYSITDGCLISNLSNVMMTAKTIGSSFEALGLVMYAVSSFPGEGKKEVHITYHDVPAETQINGSTLSKDVSDILARQYLTISCDDTYLPKKDWERIIYSYKCLPEEVGFDLKNSLFRLGKEILLSYLFDDDMMHVFLFLSNNIYRFNFHRQSISYELTEKKENQVLIEFLANYKIDPKDIHKRNFSIIVGALNRGEEKGPELKAMDNGSDLECYVKKQRLVFSQFIKEYFLEEVPVSLFVGDRKVSLVPYKKSLKQDRQIEPQTSFFKTIRLVLDEQPSLSLTSSTFVKLYYKNRRIGVYSKYPFISGYFELSEIPELLNYARTKCDSWDVREALEKEIQTALTESRKRQGEMPISQLQEEIYRPK